MRFQPKCFAHAHIQIFKRRFRLCINFDVGFVGMTCMRKGLILFGFALFVVGAFLGFYASQRNCLIAFITRGDMNFWTAVEILGGLVALAGIIIALIGLVRKT